MSAYSSYSSSYPGAPAAAQPAPAYPRHMVTAVIVSHDGARWLPQTLAGLLGQDRPVQRIIAADTGSTDDSPRLLAEAIGNESVAPMARRSGFGTAVNEVVRGSRPLEPADLPYPVAPAYDPYGGGAVADPAARGGQFGDPLGHHDELAAEQAAGTGGATEPVEWLWLLHDDCEPQTDALRQLLRTADATPTAAVVGPKLRSWYDRRQLLEVGVSIARSGRRWTGLDRREQDQGQRDQVRPVLSVSSAGMLIRRDVFEEIGGFDPALPLMRDDVDLCWRVSAAGHRVIVAPDAVLRHAEAASRERRPIDVWSAHPHRVDKAGAVYTLLANARGLLLPYVFLRILLSTLVRVVGYTLGKVPGQALDELAGLGHVMVRLPKVLGARARRARTRDRHGAVDDRSLFPAPGATTRMTVEQLVGDLAGRGSNEAFASRHGGGAVESGPGDDDADFLEVEQFARLRRIARKPAPVLFAALLVIALFACRGLIGGGVLSGGALLPAGGGASDLWSRYADAWHTVGGGTTAGSPPYLGVLAVLATVLLGKADLAVTLLLVLSVPLAGVSAYLVTRPLIDSRLVRAWAATGYAFLPAATGAVAQGRLGTAVLAVLLPPLGRAAAVAVGLGIRNETAARGGRPGWRSAWVAALLLSLATAFVPLAWFLGLVFAAAVLAHAVVRGGAFGSGGQALTRLGPRCLAIVGSPVLVLAPWSLGVLSHPGRLLLEAGTAGAVGQLPTSFDLLTLDPGGHGAVPGALALGVLLAALAALLRADRRRAVLAAWGAAAVALIGGVLVAGVRVGPGPGQTAVNAWSGPAMLVAGIALLAAAAIGADGARERVTGIDFGWRQPVAAIVLAIAVLGPVCSAGWWLVRGAASPLSRGSADLLPAFVAEDASSVDRVRTLVLKPSADGASVDWALDTGGGPQLGDAEIADATEPATGLDAVVGSLLSGSGGDPVSRLESYGVQYVMVRQPLPSSFASALDGTPGLDRLNQVSGITTWRLDDTVSRAAIEQPAGSSAASASAPASATSASSTSSSSTAPVPVPAGEVDVRATIPSGPQGRVLRLADRADSGWQATLDGRPLTATTVDGWAQGFRLPADGGRLVVTYQTGILHKVWIAVQVVLGVVLVILALPGRRDRIDDDLPEGEAASAFADVPPVPGSRRARRLAAAAEGPDGTAEAEPGVYAAPAYQPGAPEPAAAGAPDDPYAPAGADPGYPEYPEEGAGYPQPQAYPDYPGYPDYPSDPADPAAAPAGAQNPPAYGGWDPYSVQQPGTPPYGFPAQGRPAHDDPAGYGSLAPDDPWLSDENGQGYQGDDYRRGDGS
ncbi:glycosyltransferase family 2 protein [Phaeacidiphilus oryzae]|uniref:glycosyltransferase family 2 protein n=1 Tax=Phaeacidiphilus oryzae TaxID=348818 RepID=UPI000A03C674|nr:glycosyltransferase family 2 protein [Phaeacidiphilus oryzae]